MKSSARSANREAPTLKIDAYGAFLPPRDVAYRIVPTDAGVALLLGEGSEPRAETTFDDKISGVILEGMAARLSAEKGNASTRLRAAFDAGQQALKQSFGHWPQDELRGLACCVACLLVSGAEACAGWIGDAEACLVRDADIIARTEGHTWIRDQREKGLLTLEEALEHPLRHICTRALQVEQTDPAKTPEFLPKPWALQEQDVLVLATARLLERVRSGELARVVSRLEPKQGAQALVDRAGGRGAIAAVVARIESS